MSTNLVHSVVLMAISDRDIKQEITVDAYQNTFYEEAKSGVISLLKQTAIVFIFLLLMLLLVTGGKPSGFVVALSFVLGTAFVAWLENKCLTNYKAISSQNLIDLSQWLQYNFASDWLSMEAVFGLGTAIRTRKNNLDQSQYINQLIEKLCLSQDERTYRQIVESLGEVEAGNPKAIAALIKVLQTSQDNQTHQRVAESLGKIGKGNREAIAALTNLLETSHDEQTCWQAALSLGQIDPKNPNAAIVRGKRIQLGRRQAIALIIYLRRQSEQHLVIRLRVRPTGDRTYLPSKLELVVRDKWGEIFPQTQPILAGYRAYSIEQQFRLFSREHFSLQIICGTTSTTHYFVC
ncbi:MAG TPA: hypothetical protein DDZ80_22450 [Cyanobacteria bacterium UBA8803]|nr:hypothetical protein [Cyanobacteria bacterium UBA9273]HBL61088.1 hypothetical protein [Cyanobacteria bacterium UBA8803]